MDGTGVDQEMRPTRCTYMQLLPVELIAEILGYLDVWSLRSAAGVSRMFYASAWDLGLTISRWISLGIPKFWLQLAVIEEVVRHAVPKKLALSLTVFSRPPDGIDNGDSVQHRSALVSTIDSANPVLVSLSLTVDGNYCELMEPLRRPMPRLRTLSLTRSSLRETHQSIYLDPEWISSHVPLLRHVILDTMILGAAAGSPAFANVTSLHIFDHDPLRRVAFGLHFPKLLHLSLQTAHVEPSHGSQPSLDLNGVSLRSLTIEDDGILIPALMGLSALDAIPLIRLTRLTMPPWIEPADDRETDIALCLTHLARKGYTLTASVVPSHMRWRRVYYIDYWPKGVPLTAPSRAAHLTYLRLDAELLEIFLACDTAFPVLRRIRLDVWRQQGSQLRHAEADPAGGSSVPCAALYELALVARPIIGVDSAGIYVRPREVMSLSRALGQHARPQHEKARLVLVGLDFVSDSDSEGLEPEVSLAELTSTYSTAIRRPLAKEDDEQALWYWDV